MAVISVLPACPVDLVSLGPMAPVELLVEPADDPVPIAFSSAFCGVALSRGPVPVPLCMSALPGVRLPALLLVSFPAPAPDPPAPAPEPAPAPCAPATPIHPAAIAAIIHLVRSMGPPLLIGFDP
ncbi:MAG TPA: hypothetical protein VEM76_18725 [Anaeromyxobacteraceae bacterium]|nr:hypothetical protein [Anaeromyxobacteraceae bacterium]